MINIDKIAASSKTPSFKNYQDKIVTVSIPSHAIGRFAPAFESFYSNSTPLNNSNGVSRAIVKVGSEEYRVLNGKIIFNSPDLEDGPLQTICATYYSGGNLVCAVGFRTQYNVNIPIGPYDVIFRVKLFELPV